MFVKNSHRLLSLIFVIILFSTTCKKLENYEGNNIEFRETIFEIEDEITYIIQNSELDFSQVTIGGINYNLLSFANCMELKVPALLTFGLGDIDFTIDYEAFIPTSNPNPLADLANDIHPKSLELELTNITDCDLSMLEEVTLYLVMDDVSGSVSDFTMQNPANPTEPHNAVKLGQYLNIPESVGSKMSLVVNEDAVLDQFIHAGTFQTYMSLVFDKAFTANEAIIKSSMKFEVKLTNEQ